MHEVLYLTYVYSIAIESAFGHISDKNDTTDNETIGN